MGVSINQMTNDGYFPTQKDHLHLLEGRGEGYLQVFALAPHRNNGGHVIRYQYLTMGEVAVSCEAFGKL